MAAAVQRRRLGLVASGHEPLPLLRCLRTRPRAGPQVELIPIDHGLCLPEIVSRCSPTVGRRAAAFLRPRLLNAMRSDAAVGGGGAGSGGPTTTCRGASPRNWNSAEAPRWELKIGCMLIQNVPKMTHNPYTIYT